MNRGVLTMALLAVVALAACKSEPPANAPRACCEQPKIPPSVTPFVVVADDVEGPSDGEKVKIRAGVSQPLKRDAAYGVLKTLYVHAMKRHTFEPIDFVAEVYPSEAAAKSGGSGWIAKIWRGQSDKAPICENKVEFDFTEQTERAFAASTGFAAQEDSNDTCQIAEKKKVVRFDEKFTHKASYKLDPAAKSVEVTHHYLELGKDEYVADLKFTSAMRDFTEYMTGMFARVPDLKQLTFVGVHNEEPVLRIAVTREQYNSSLSSLQESIAAHAAITFATLGMGKKDDKGAAKEQREFHTKTYKNALAALPKSQVTISKKLK